jgi:hypothetical protein
MSRTKSLIVAVVLALCASGGFAQDWRGELKMVDNDLRTQHYEHARKWSIKLINSMSDHLGTGEAASYTMSLAVAYRALAEAGLNKPADADWYWHVANSIYPPIAKSRDWSVYGKVGEWAANHTDDLEVAEGTVVPIKKVDPVCPLGAIQGAYYQPIRVGAIVDGDGNARCPTLVANPNAPTLEYAAFEALKQWQFQTAAPAKYEVTVDFLPPKQ